MISLRRHAVGALPLVLLLALYWPGLTGWFYQDDFGWLRLRQQVHSVSHLPSALFAPQAHGNMRPLGENAYWLVLARLFGAKLLPFRLCAFATAMAALWLLAAIARRLVKQPAAGVWAPILWLVNCGLAPAMGWSSIYNQILSSFFFLLAFYFLLRVAETGSHRHRLGHWAAFLLGLGALEINVVYPALAALYCWLFARPLLKKVLPMFAVSVAFVLVHFVAAPAPHQGAYALHPDLRILATVGTYWAWALGPVRLAAVSRFPLGLAWILTALLTLALVPLAWRQARRGDSIGLFGLAWFVIVLGPYLPLADHRMDYYLAAPAIGLAIAGAWAVGRADASAGRIATVLCLAAYLVPSAGASWAIGRWQHDRGLRVEDFVLGVAEIHQSDPPKIILLEGVDDDLFWAGMADLPFLALEIPRVYLAPGSESAIRAAPDLLSKFVLPRGLARNALARGQAVVYRVDGRLLRNQTNRYRATVAALWPPEVPRFVNIGDPVFAEFLGPGWGPAANGYRVMPGPEGAPAAVRIGGPRSPAEQLYIGVFRTRDFTLSLEADGIALPLHLARRDLEISEYRATLPLEFVGRDEIHLSLAAGTPSKPVGFLTFGYVEIR